MAIEKGKTEKRKSYCILCAKERDGIPVKEDNVIKAIRLIKRHVLKSEKRNRLVVCKECYADYKKYRKRYTRRQAIYVGLGIVFLIMLLAISPTWQSKLSGALIGIGMTLLLYLLSLLNHVPEIDIPSDGRRSARAGEASASNK
ncbi:MAG: hypothetical protein M1321_00905 [Candidatus Marsarchaeota archaeon]|jgi:hypothetical protein|nr:hypothetical protein [Candidatus Marsarchaeota archaeon]